jgi:undecaprenyl-diphosphatase
MGLGDTKELRDALDAYTVIIQFGAILAVLVVSWARVVSVVRGLLGRDPVGRRLAVNLVVAFIPAAIVGLAFSDAIDRHLLEPGPVAGALVVGGLAIVALTPRLRARSERGDPLDRLGIRAAFVIGLLQTLALWPGTSRSLVTILGGLAVGLTVVGAVEFSFLLGLVTLTAATVLATLKDGSAVLDDYGVMTPLIGIVAAAVSAFVAVRSFVAYLRKRELTAFGWYRIGVGLLIFVLLAFTSVF